MSVPRPLEILVALLLPARDREVVLGDLEEMYRHRLRDQGNASATHMYLRDGIASALARRLRRTSAPILRRNQLKPGGTMLSDIPSDIRLALRSLRLRPGFSALVVLTLALGIGATTAVFALANQVLLRPLPGVKDPRGVAYLEFRRAEEPERRTGIAALDFIELREAATSLEGLAAYNDISWNVTLGDAAPLRVSGTLIRGDYFGILSVRPSQGRLLYAEETGLGADPDVVVVSEAFWTSALGGAESVVGRTISLDGRAVSIVGVAGDGFAGAERGDRIEIWRPMSVRSESPEELEARGAITHGSNSGNVLARPRRGVTMEAVESEVRGIFERMAQDNRPSAAHLASLRPTIFPGLHTTPLYRQTTYATLRIMSYIVLMVLLIACANAANLLLFRGLRRRADVAVRRALGAGGARVARQELVESLVLTVLGCAGGIAFGWSLALLFRGDRLVFRSETFEGMVFDVRVFAFAVAVVFITTLLAGVLPAALTGRVDLTDTLREAGRGQTPGRGALRGAICAAQIALCIPLLVGAFLLTRTVRNLYALDLGMTLEGAMAVFVNGAGRQAFAAQAQLLDAVRSVPGVESSVLDYPGFGGGVGGEARLPQTTREQAIDISHYYVSPGWFELLRIEPLSGRTFQAGDWGEGAPPRVLITAPLARRLFGQTDVVGRTVISRFNEDVEAEIVGVVGDLRLRGPEQPAEEALLVPYHRMPLSQIKLLIRSARSDARLQTDVQRAVASVLPDVPPAQLQPLTAQIDTQLAEQRVFARLLNLVSAITVGLAALGLYGVIAFSVVARRRELGIRITLGSSRRRIAALVGRQVVVIVGAALPLGLLGANALSRMLENQLVGLSASDPISYAGGALLLVLVAVTACLVPLRSAVRVDPAVTLREE